MSKKMVTVFGGSGFVGRYVVRLLAKRGYRIRVAVRRPNLAGFLLPMGDVGQIQLLPTNLTHEDTIARALDGSDVAVNLVGILAQSGKQKFDAIHGEGPGLIGRYAKVTGVKKLVQISAIGADENSPARYAQSKAAGEKAIRAENAETTIIRPSVVFGPEDQFFNRFSNLLRYLPVAPLIGGGQTKFQPIYVGDLAEAIVRCVEDDATNAQTYELGGGTVYSLKEVFELCLRITERSRPMVSLPFWMMSMQAAVMGLLPGAPLTLDQVRLLRLDNVVNPNAGEEGIKTLADFGITPTPAEAILPTYLWRFRKHGQYETSRI